MYIDYDKCNVDYRWWGQTHTRNYMYMYMYMYILYMYNVCGCGEVVI